MTHRQPRAAIHTRSTTTSPTSTALGMVQVDLIPTLSDNAFGGMALYDVMFMGHSGSAGVGSRIRRTASPRTSP